MEIELITKHDLELFKHELLAEMTKLIRPESHSPGKQYLRTKEVRQILKISSGTLANLRVKGLLHPTKIEGVYYYQQSEITALLSAGSSSQNI